MHEGTENGNRLIIQTVQKVFFQTKNHENSEIVWYNMINKLIKTIIEPCYKKKNLFHRG